MIIKWILIASALLGIQMLPLAGVSEVMLRDQYGNEDRLAAHRGEVVVAMVVTAKRLRNLRDWEEELRNRFENIHYFRVADIPEKPPATYEQVAEKLVKRVPEGVSIWIDLERRWAKVLALDTDRPNILIIDRDGRLIASYRGRRDPALLANVIHHLEKLTGGS